MLWIGAADRAHLTVFQREEDTGFNDRHETILIGTVVLLEEPEPRQERVNLGLCAPERIHAPAVSGVDGWPAPDSHFPLLPGLEMSPPIPHRYSPGLRPGLNRLIGTSPDYRPGPPRLPRPPAALSKALPSRTACARIQPELDTGACWMPTIRRICQSCYTPCRPAIQLASGEFGFAMPAKKPARSSRRTDDTSEGLHVLFGENLRQARLKAELSQAEVAARSRMGQPYISEIKTGLRDLTLGTMASVARAVGTDVRTLLKQARKRK
jgi:hypothetical protein